MGLRPIRHRDRRAWLRLRRDNREWLREWDATMPPGGPSRASSFTRMVRDLRALAREGRALPFVVTDIIRLVILIAFPIIALWLPSRM